MIRFRRLRWVGPSLIAAVMAVCAVGAAAASAGGRARHRSASPGCYPKGSTTIAQDKAGRFYSSGRPDSSSGGSWYVCAFKQGMRWRLYAAQRGRSFAPVDGSAKVSGPYVAFLVVGPGPSSIHVFDMVTGQSRFVAGVYPVGSLPSASFVLKANGSVAWMSRSTRVGARTWYVNRHDSTGTATVDSGPAIDPHSLAAGGAWLYWTDAGSARSAPFH
jgi:hypothetical protein